MKCSHMTGRSQVSRVPISYVLNNKAPTTLQGKVFVKMPSYISTQPEIFTKPPEKITSDWRKPGQLTDEQVKQFFDEVSYK